MNKNRGFTLIELLVVIAIIGILSSVVLASLNTARSKGTDAAIKSDLDNIRAEAEIFYDGVGGNTYTSVCSTDTTFARGVIAALNAGGAALTVATPPALNCVSNATTWTAWAPLKATTGQWWCVDNTGVSKLETSAQWTTLAAGTLCP